MDEETRKLLGIYYLADQPKTQTAAQIAGTDYLYKTAPASSYSPSSSSSSSSGTTQNASQSVSQNNNYDYSNYGGVNDVSSYFSQAEDSIKNYVSALRQTAHGDYDFAVKFITKQFETALGTDDAKRAQFFVQVSDELEKQIGQIPYDYLQKTEREKEDLVRFLQKQNVQSEDLLAREAEFAKQQQFASGIEKRQISEQANTRGMFGSGIEKRQQAEATTSRQLYEQEPFNRQAALERALREMETEAGKTISQRNLEDIKTQARRLALGEQTRYDYNSEAAKRDLESRQKELDAMQQEKLDILKSQYPSYV